MVHPDQSPGHFDHSGMLIDDDAVPCIFEVTARNDYVGAPSDLNVLIAAAFSAVQHGERFLFVGSAVEPSINLSSFPNTTGG